MPRTHRSRFFTIRVISFAIVGGCLLGDLQAVQRDGDSAVLTDTPRCRFAWPPGWDYTTIPGALILTKDTLDKSMIGVMRVRAGDTLTQGKTKVAARMSTQQIAAVLRESVQGRKERVESLTFDDTTVASVPAVRMRMRYTRPGSSTPIGAVEYGFVKGGYFFHVFFQAVDGPDYGRLSKEFQKVVSTFKTLE